ncbi:MAG: sugar MFS transporter [Terracidiphilus sp.]|jgi:FHS family L-fucose permease-like MFS transporter
MATSSNPAAAKAAPSYTGPFITVAILFGIFGFLTSLNNVLVKKLEDIFQLSHGPAMLATAAWFFAYLVFSVPAAKVIEAVGYKRTMVISLFVMAGGAALFLPAANLVSFPMTLFAIFVLASGVCGLQTSANPYVSILGPEHSAPSRLTLAQAVNSIGSLAAPWVAGVFILSDPSKMLTSAATAHMLHGPYIAIAIALLLLGVTVTMLHLPPVTMTSDSSPAADGLAVERSIWSHSHTVLGMVGIFFYVGLEIALASITIQFCLAQGMTKVETASLMVSLFYLGMMIGRLLGSAIMVWIKADKLLILLGLCGVALLGAAMVTHGTVAIACLVLTGLANSIMYPTIFALGVAELGPLTSKGSGVLTIGNVGGAVIPPLFGMLADKTSIQYAFIIPIVGYLYVAYYGMWGHKPSRKEAA